MAQMAIAQKLLRSAAAVFLIMLFLCSCNEEDLRQVDEFVQDVNKVAQGTQAVLESPAGQLVPIQVKLYGALGLIIANGLIMSWQEWRNRTMKKTTRAIVKGIETSERAKNPSNEVKKSIAQEMIFQGGDKFYQRANKIVDRLKIS
jgi:hypothetical protein